MAIKTYIWVEVQRLLIVQSILRIISLRSNVVMEKDISLYPPKILSEKRYCQIRFSDCVFQLRIILYAWT